MNWKDYEEEAHQHLIRAYPNADISRDVFLLGQYSKTKRQIDVLIDHTHQSKSERIVVDAKYFSKKVDVKCVESFISMLEDVGCEKGLLVTQKGYSKAAFNRAYFDPRGIELDILNLDDLKHYQALQAVPYSGDRAIYVSAPFGWVVDAKKRDGVLALLYQRGLSFDDAAGQYEWMYVNFWRKDHFASDIDELIELQNKGIIDQNPSAEISLVTTSERNDGRPTKIRCVRWPEHSFKEITGYIDGDDFIVFFVLFTPFVRENRNTEKLQQVLLQSTPAEIKFDNTRVIEQLEGQLHEITDPVEKATAYCQLADWQAEMGQDDLALANRRLCWEIYPQIYRNIGPLISGELLNENFEAAARYSAEFFYMDPHNPRVMQDLINIYDGDSNLEWLKCLIANLKTKFSDDAEAVANLCVHFGMHLVNHLEDELAVSEFEQAKQKFHEVSEDHFMIAELDRMLGQI